MKKALLALVLAAVMPGAVLASDDLAYWNRVIQWAATGNTNAVIIDNSRRSGFNAIGVVDPVVYRPSGAAVVAEIKTPLPLAGTGKKVAATAAAPITRAGFVRGLGLAAANPLVGIGLAIAAPAAMEWLESGGVKLNPNASSDPGHPFVKASQIDYPGWEWSVKGSALWFPNPGEACQAGTPSAQDGRFVFSRLQSSGGFPIACWYTHERVNQPPEIDIYWLALNRRGTTDLDPEYLPASMSDIAQYMDRPEAPALTPTAVQQAVKAGVDPFGAQYPKPTVTGPSTVPGEQKSTSTQVRVHPGTTTEVAPGYSGETQDATKVTTTAATHNVTYNTNTATYNTSNVTTTTITNNVTNQTTNVTETTQTDNDAKPQEPIEIETCGLPGKPKCLIDETGTPDAKQDTGEADAKQAIKPLDDFLQNPTQALPQLPTINWAFTLPSGCAPIALPAFDPWLQEIDICAFQPMFHDIMSFLWVMGGIFGAIGTFWRNTFSQG